MNVLYDYIFHILLNFDLVHKSNTHEKNSYFIPSGYDRLSVLKSNDTQKDLDYEYSDKIKPEKEEEPKKEEEEIKCEKLSDYLHNIKNRTFKSRKSMMRDNIKMGKSLVDSGHKINKDEPKEQKDDKSGNAGEKVNKFQKFMDKRDSKQDPDVLGNFENKMSKEERAKLTRENLLNKLRLSKKK